MYSFTPEWSEARGGGGSTLPNGTTSKQWCPSDIYLQILRQEGIELSLQPTANAKRFALPIVQRPFWYRNDSFSVSVFGIIPRANKSCLHYSISRLCLPERYVRSCTTHRIILSIKVLNVSSKNKLWEKTSCFCSMQGGTRIWRHYLTYVSFTDLNNNLLTHVSLCLMQKLHLWLWLDTGWTI